MVPTETVCTPIALAGTFNRCGRSGPRGCRATGSALTFSGYDIHYRRRRGGAAFEITDYWGTKSRDADTLKLERMR